MTDTVSESILTSIKKLLGIDEAEESFDVDIKFAINSAMMILNQLGVGPVDCFLITDKTSTWSSFLGTSTDLESVKSYIYIKTKLLFDPPTSGILVGAFENQLKELEFRLNIQAEPRRPVPIVIDEE